jgi:D-beta-D-heptose 7-phosphate kinase/D-beta-D-heptose 1-phosphate adenosyltransferase
MRDLDFSAARILVAGDTMLDVYLGGAVERISPEAPVPVVRLRDRRAVPGGAGNVAANVASLGGRVTLAAILGDDAEGREAAELTRACGVDVRVTIDATRPTVTKTRVLSGAQQLLRLDREDARDAGADAIARFVETVIGALPESDVVVLSDYAKGTLTPDALGAIIAAAISARVPVLVDPKRKDFSVYRGASLVKPNRSELRAATGIATDTDEATAQAAAAAIAATGADLLLTRSDEGMTLFPADGGAAVHMPTRARTVYDVSGAGDTVIAAQALATAARLPVEARLRFANLAAGVVVSKIGTATATLSEIAAIADDEDAPADERKGALVSLDEAVALRAAWKRRGLSVGFTNGCFDLLHPGHVALLRQARAACDRLIVALNTDASVSRLKGPSRPVQDEFSRATVMGALDPVDLVILFGEDTPIAAITALAPDVLVKGADYREDQVVGAAVVKAAGGRVVLAKLEDGHSTSRLVARGRA